MRIRTLGEGARASAVLFCLFFSLSTTGALAMPGLGGSLPTDPAVAESTGAAGFRIPVATPPGPGGLAPNVALAYSSRAGDGPYGVGWRIEIPEIRCSARFGVPDFASCATYELDDALLVEDPAHPRTYHTLVESFSRIRFHPLGNVWTVERPGGGVLVFGGAATHRVEQDGATARWLLQRMEDEFGNAVFYEYDRADLGAPHPAAITYGAGAAPGSGPREIRFRYEARPDARLVFAGGVERRMVRRLREVQVLGHGALFRRYVIGYAPAGDPATRRSRLASVQEFGSDCTATDPGTCTGLPRRTFRYRDAGDAPAEPVSDDAYRIRFGDYSALDPSLFRNGLPQLIGDFDGNGLPDRIELLAPKSTAPASLHVWMNSGEGWVGSADSGPYAVLAATYEQSLASLRYDKPRLEYAQIPAHASSAGGKTWVDRWNDTDRTVFAMCSVRRTIRAGAHLSEELFPRGVFARTSSVADLRASHGAPSEGFLEPMPSVRVVDLDGDGRAELVLSLRLSGLRRDFACGPASPEEIPPSTFAVVFRNVGTGWVNDAAARALAEGLPPFEEVVVQSSYRTEVEDSWPQLVQGGDAAKSPCANLSVKGFEQHDDFTSSGPTDPAYQGGVCYNPIDLAPHFADFDGDGYPDLAVLVRDDPGRLWTGVGYGLQYNHARTRVWVQRPDASPRWQRAPRYDLPYDAWSWAPDFEMRGGLAHTGLYHFLEGLDTTPGGGCYSWSPTFENCGPNTYRVDLGVRLVDVNADGLTDVVWALPPLLAPPGAASGVFLNRGGGAGQPFGAWCRSGAAGAAQVPDSCPEAARYAPPAPLAEPICCVYNMTTEAGKFADLNGDGLPDFVRLNVYENHLPARAWLQSPGADGASVWARDARFDFPIDWGRRGVTHPFHGYEVVHGEGAHTFLARFEAFDVDGDGSDDLVGDLNAFRSGVHHADLLRVADDGRGVAVSFEYASAITQRDPLEGAAAATAWEGDAGALWRPLPVVSSLSLRGPNLAAPGHVTRFAYSRPRTCRRYHSDLGFGGVRQERPGGSAVEQEFYQDHGRAGRIRERVVLDEHDRVVQRYAATWAPVPAPPPGSIAGVFLARLVREQSANEYDGVPGATLVRTYAYSDARGVEHGYGFVHKVATVRPSGVLIETREPDSDLFSYVVGRVAERTLRDETGALLAATRFSYVDLDGDDTGPVVAGRSEWVSERGSAEGIWVDALALRLDRYGNAIEEVTPSPQASEAMRSTFYCYDGDGGWCPRGVGTSHGVRVGVRDALGVVTRTIPEPSSGIVTLSASDYRDQPATRVELDPFSRPLREYATPAGGGEVLVARNVYHDDAGAPAHVERFAYTNEERSAWIHRVTVSDGLGGIWKRMERVSSGAFVGEVTFVDPEQRLTRTTLPVSCADPTCAAVTGQLRPAARAVRVDSLGRPIRIDTRDGFALRSYRAAADRELPGPLGGMGAFDAVLEKNAAGALHQRILDGERSVWVDECDVGIAAGTATLEDVVCGSADTTLYTYEATGEVRAIYDPRAVAADGFDDPNHILRYAYDTRGRVLRVEDPDLAGAGARLSRYDDSGALASTTNARGETRRFRYDRLGRLVGVATPEGEDDYAVIYRASERGRGAEGSQVYSRVYHYDGWGHVRQTELSVAGSGPLQPAWSQPYLTDYRYDVAGRVVEIVHPEATRVRYEYGSGHRGARLERVCDLGSASSCSGWGVVEYVRDVGYDALGRRVITETAAGTRTFAYDGSTERLREDRFAASSDPYRFERHYDAYDELGNPKRIHGSSTPGDVAMDEEFTYDSRNRLSSWTVGGESYAYAYDDLGNLVLHGGIAQVFDDPERPHAIRRRSAGGASYGYDDDGNLTTNGGGRRYAFDSASRLVCIGSAPGDCGLGRVHYDLDGQRVLDDKARLGTRFVHASEDAIVVSGWESRIEIRAFGERVAYKTTTAAFRTAAQGGPTSGIPLLAWGGAAVVVLALWGLGPAPRRTPLLRQPPAAALSAVLVMTLVLGPVPLAAGGGGGTAFYWELADRLGSTTVMLDATGARLVHRTRSPFGGIHASAGRHVAMRDHYAGHLRDSASGLVFMQARWMDPETGTFLSIDPLVPARGDPQALNAYAYARNNPVQRIDPTGAASCVSIFACGMATPTGTLATVTTTSYGMSTTDGAGNTYTTTAEVYTVGGRIVGGDTSFQAGYAGEMAPAALVPGASGFLSAAGSALRGAVQLLIGENFGAAWLDFLRPWEEGPTGGWMPRSLAQALRAVRDVIPNDAAANGMHAWHAGSNAAVAGKLGLLGAPLILLAGVLHESPLDLRSFLAEQRFQGTVNHALDSLTDIGANAFGLGVGYALPRGSAVAVAMVLGNHIPGPGEPDPAFGGLGAYHGNPLAAWGQSP